MTELITPRHKKKMLKYILKHVRKFPTVNVAEGLVEFVERKRVLSSGTSARPGPYRFSVTPYLREIAEEFSEYTKTTEGACMKPTQWGYTDGILLNHQAYCIYYGIGPILYVTSDDDLAGEYMEKRVDPMLKDSGMQDLITPSVEKKGNKSTGDTKRSKSFKGTFLKAIGARSESKLSSVPIRVLHLDEEDKYPVSLAGGGDSTEKAKRRTDSYGNLKKVLHGSTPKLKASSKIEPVFKQGDMRYYNWKCPECGTYQNFIWSQLKWDKNENGKIDLHYDDDGYLVNNPVWYECINKDCDRRIKDYEKVSILKEEGYGGTAKWIPTKKPDRPGLKSWKGHGLEGFRSWVDIVVQWDQIEGDPILLQDFINDVLGETYEEKIDKPDEHYLAARAEQDWERGMINERVHVLTLGTDVHPDRLEAHLVGWTRRKESWSIEYYVFQGNTNDPNDDTWDNLEDVIRDTYTKQNGDNIKIQVTFIDAGGKQSESVMNFCERFPYNPRHWVGVYPIFGKQTLSAIVKEHVSTIGTPEILIADQLLKFEIYSSLKRKVPPAGHKFPTGYLHFPKDYSEDYYKQLVAEEIAESVNSKGVSTWFIHNTKQRRNETLDTFKMCLAGIYYIYLTYFKLLNASRKAKKKKEIKPTWEMFWSSQGIHGDAEEVDEGEE